MTSDDSPIIDFYPPSFEIDMNGKKMAWQGVALLPFIDEKRLLDAMAPHYPQLTEEEIKRNRWGSNAMFASDEHPIYPFYERLYGKRKSQDVCPFPFNGLCTTLRFMQPEIIDVHLSKGISGTVLPNPDCLPGSTYYSPLPQQELSDIRNDRSLSMIYLFPKQLRPHRSELLPGARKPPRQLSVADLETTRAGGRGRGRGGPPGPNGGGRNSWNGGGQADWRNDPFHTRPNNYGNHASSGGRGGRGSRGNPPYPPRPSYPQGVPSSSYQHSGPSGGGYGPPSGRPPPSYGGYGRGAPPPRGGSPNGYGGYGPGISYGTYGGGGHGNYGGSGAPSYASRGAPSRGRGRGQ